MRVFTRRRCERVRSRGLLRGYLLSAPDSSPFSRSGRRRGNALLRTNREGESPLSLSPPSAPSSAAPVVITRVCLHAAKGCRAPAASTEGRGGGGGGCRGGEEANSCLTSSQSEAWLRLTEPAGPARAPPPPPPHSSFEALVEMCRLLCLLSLAWCTWSRVFWDIFFE